MTVTAEVTAPLSGPRTLELPGVGFFGLHSSVNLLNPGGLEGLEPAATGAGNHNNSARSFEHTLEFLAAHGYPIRTFGRVVGIVGADDRHTFVPNGVYLSADNIEVPGCTRLQEYRPGRREILTVQPTHYILDGDPLAQFKAKLAAVPPGHRFVIGGSVPPGFPSAASIYTDLTIPAIKAGRRPLVDLRKDELPVVLNAIRTAGLCADFKANEEELSGLAGYTLDPEELATLLELAKDYNPHGMVFESLGPNGTICYYGGDSWLNHAELPDGEQYIHPIGCGDTLVGAALACLTNGLSPELSFRIAVAAAVAQLATRHPGYFKRSVLEKILAYMESDPSCSRRIAWRNN